MSRRRDCSQARFCALSVLAMLLPAAADFVRAEDNPTSAAPLIWTWDQSLAAQDSFATPVAFAASGDDALSLVLPVDEPMDGSDRPPDELPPVEPLAYGDAAGAWSWQWSPTGLIYHSYMAGPHEPRMALVSFYDGENHAYWDASLGARVGFLRYGDCDPQRPQGFQLDFYGAAISRLDVEHRQDLVSTDYVFGFPLTYGVGDWQFKFGYAHTSSHLGDERAVRVPGSLAERVNYVRDGLVLGVSHYPYPFWRQYAEAGWAFNTSGGAEPFEFQFGTELSPPGPTGRSSAPFLAVNAHLREEHNYGGDFAVQTGWLRRGQYGQTLRAGIHYFVGKSSQYQFFDDSEQQLGLGIWYDL